MGLDVIRQALSSNRLTLSPSQYRRGKQSEVTTDRMDVRLKEFEMVTAGKTILTVTDFLDLIYRYANIKRYKKFQIQ